MTIPKLLWYYGLRPVDLLHRYGGTVLRSRRQQVAIDVGLKRKAHLMGWLENHSTEM